MRFFSEIFQKNFLLISVFVTGAAVLIVEVVAVRILAPYFGNTIFTYSSVITVILAALSIGYYFGGKFADKYPSLRWFFGIIFAGGLSVLLLRILTSLLLPVLGYLFSLTTGPLVSSMILFASPSFLLGVLSPFAIRLQREYFPEKEVGSISGEVFFWSTAGSIFGSLSAGYFLIPKFGVNEIITGVGIALIIVGFAGFLRRAKKAAMHKKLIAAAMILSLIAVYLDWLERHNHNFLYRKDGIYEKITVLEKDQGGRRVRFLMQDLNPSSGIFVDTGELAFEYTKYYALYKIFTSSVKDALFIGGGGSTIPKAMLQELPEVSIDVVEIEPLLEGLSKKFFGLPDSPRLKYHVADGRRFLYQNDTKYDFIFGDVYSSFLSIPVHFTTKEFFEIARTKLNPEGIFIANVVGSLAPDSDSFLLSEMRTFQSVFPNSYFFGMESPKSYETQNTIFVGYNSDKKIDFNAPEIKYSENYIISELQGRLISTQERNLPRYQIFTDNFAPVEYVTSKFLGRL